MRHVHLRGGLPGGNPLANVLVIIVGSIAIAASLVLGFFAFVVLGSIVLVMASIVGLRVWWFSRKFRKMAEKQGTAGAEPDRGVIEGQFRIIAEDREGE